MKYDRMMIEQKSSHFSSEFKYKFAQNPKD